MSKISKIANEGIQYDLGGSGDDDVKFVEFSGGFLLLKKVHHDIVTVFLNTSVSNSDINISGDFTGFEGNTKITLGGTSNDDILLIDFSVTSNKICLDVGLSAFASRGTSGAGIYRVGSTN